MPCKLAQLSTYLPPTSLQVASARESERARAHTHSTVHYMTRTLHVNSIYVTPNYNNMHMCMYMHMSMCMYMSMDMDMHVSSMYMHMYMYMMSMCMYC